METIHTRYLGGLRTKAIHLQSGNELITDAPTDNHGRGEAFSPTDLVATALGSCMISVIGIAAMKHNFDVDGTELKITKKMSAEPRRIAEIVVEFIFPPQNYSEKEKAIIDHCIKTCPVSLSLCVDVKQTILINW